MPETLISVDLSKSPYENTDLHNRWHPDIPIATWVEPGADFVVETVDWTGGAIKNDNSADDVRDVDLSTVHFPLGPRSELKAPSPAISLSSIFSTLARSKGTNGVSTASSRRRTVAAS